MPEPAFLYDDAYITLASAQALWRGYDSYFTGTPALFGITSPFHCLLVAGLLAVLPPLWALLMSSLLGTVAYAIGLWRLGGVAGLSRALQPLFVLAGLGPGMMAQHLVNGLETSWALAVVTWMIWASQTGHTRALAVIAATAPFVRPELAVLSLAMLALTAFRHPDRRRELALSSLAAALPWLALLAWQLGGIVPSTLAAKRHWYAEACWPVSRRTDVVGRGLIGWLAGMPIVALGLAGVLTSGMGRATLAASAAVLAAWAWSVPNVLHAYQRHRYYAIFLPLLLYGLLYLPRWCRPIAIGLASVMAAISITSVVRFEPQAIADAMTVRQRTASVLHEQGASRVLLHDAGYLAFTSAGRTGVDMVGLKTPAAADLHARLTGPTCGQGRSDALRQLVQATQPSHVVVWAPWDEYFHVTDALRAGGWAISRVSTVPAPEPVYVYSIGPAGPQ